MKIDGNILLPLVALLLSLFALAVSVLHEFSPKPARENATTGENPDSVGRGSLHELVESVEERREDHKLSVPHLDSRNERMGDKPTGVRVNRNFNGVARPERERKGMRTIDVRREEPVDEEDPGTPNRKRATTDVCDKKRAVDEMMPRQHSRVPQLELDGDSRLGGGNLPPERDDAHADGDARETNGEVIDKDDASGFHGEVGEI